MEVPSSTLPRGSLCGSTNGFRSKWTLSSMSGQIFHSVCLQEGAVTLHSLNPPHTVTYIPSRYWVPRNSLKVPGHSLSQPSTIPGVPSAKLQELTIFNPTTSSKETASLLTAESGPLADYIKLNFSALDEWWEESSQILYHPRDPYHRVDVLPSGRKIRIEVDGVVLADTTNEGGVMSLWETSFPGRWYLPRTSVRADPQKPHGRYVIGFAYKQAIIIECVNADHVY